MPPRKKPGVFLSALNLLMWCLIAAVCWLIGAVLIWAVYDVVWRG